MGKKEIKPKIVADVELEISEKEEKRIIDEGEEKQEKDVPKFKIRRTRKQYVTKMGTPLKYLEIEFTNEQRARRNSEYTIKHYHRTFLKLYEFCAFISAEKDSISKTYDLYEDKDNPLAYVGQNLPIAALEQNDFQMWFVRYLSDNGANDQTITSYLRDYRAIMYYCMEQGWIDPYKIVIKDKPTPIKDCYTHKELEKLLKKKDSKYFTEYRNWVIVNYLLATGNRIQTLINIKVGDVDLEDGYININVQKNKNVSRLSLVSKMVTILREYIQLFRTDDEGCCCPRTCSRSSPGSRASPPGSRPAPAARGGTSCRNPGSPGEWDTPGCRCPAPA